MRSTYVNHRYTNIRFIALYSCFRFNCSLARHFINKLLKVRKIVYILLNLSTKLITTAFDLDLFNHHNYTQIILKNISFVQSYRKVSIFRVKSTEKNDQNTREIEETVRLNDLSLFLIYLDIPIDCRDVDSKYS